MNKWALSLVKNVARVEQLRTYECLQVAAVAAPSAWNQLVAGSKRKVQQQRMNGPQGGDWNVERWNHHEKLIEGECQDMVRKVR